MEIPEETLVLDLSKKPLEHPGVIYSRLHEKIWKTSGIAGTFYLADRWELMGIPWGFSSGSENGLVLSVLKHMGTKRENIQHCCLVNFQKTVPFLLDLRNLKKTPSIFPLILIQDFFS